MVDLMVQDRNSQSLALFLLQLRVNLTYVMLNVTHHSLFVFAAFTAFG